MKEIYLDYNGTTPIANEVTETILHYLQKDFGNPSSSHNWGKKSNKALQDSRQIIAEFLNCNSDEIIFTGGGTEANNLALRGFCQANKAKGNHIITSEIEHPAVIEVMKYLAKNGFEISYIPVDKFGIINLEKLAKAIREETILISVMLANNEVGTIQPVSKIKEIIGNQDIALHTDAAQAIGKIDVNISKLGVDMLSVAGHKIYAPKGIGALYIKDGIKVEPIIFGASQEKGLRPGTENVAYIAGLAKAFELINIEKDSKKYRNLRDYFEEKLKQTNWDYLLNGHPKLRLPNTSNIGFAAIKANEFLTEHPHFAASAGVACHAGGTDVSATLKAMKVPLKYAKGTIRFSFGRFTTKADIDLALEILEKYIEG